MMKSTSKKYHDHKTRVRPQLILTFLAIAEHCLQKDSVSCIRWAAFLWHTKYCKMTLQSCLYFHGWAAQVGGRRCNGCLHYARSAANATFTGHLDPSLQSACSFTESSIEVHANSWKLPALNASWIAHVTYAWMLMHECSCMNTVQRSTFCLDTLW